MKCRCGVALSTRDMQLLLGSDEAARIQAWLLHVFNACYSQEIDSKLPSSLQCTKCQCKQLVAADQTALESVRRTMMTGELL